MTKSLDLIGHVSGRLTVVERVDNNKFGKSVWKCLCECGNEKHILGSRLHSFKTKSCGCLMLEQSRNIRRTHGMTNSNEYNSWRGMRARCSDTNNSHYHLYGARGISYVNEWESFEIFFKDMGSCPEGCQIDRVDVNKGYSKENCRWADKTVQAFNIRLKSNNISGRTGVSILPSGNFKATITVYKKIIYIGTFPTFEDACAARADAELKYYGVVKN